MDAQADLAFKTRTVDLFIVEDSASVRERLYAMLSGIPGVRVVGYAEDAADAIDAIALLNPNIVLLDLRLRSGTGIEVLQAVKRVRPEIECVVLSNFATEQYRDRCLAAGAEHFLDKTYEFERLVGIVGQSKSNGR